VCAPLFRQPRATDRRVVNTESPATVLPVLRAMNPFIAGETLSPWATVSFALLRPATCDAAGLFVSGPKRLGGLRKDTQWKHLASGGCG
jgi:hypothetical protein